MGEVIVNPHMVQRQTTLRDSLMPQPLDPVPQPTPEGSMEVAFARMADMIEEVAEGTRDKWLSDPVLWAQDRLGITPWSRQVDILHSIRDNDLTAVHTCHNIGKSYAAALAVCWWIDAHEPGEAFAVTTAPTGAQVKAILWRYINAMHSKAQLVGRTNMTEWVIGQELVAYGRKPSEYQPDAFQGIHARFVLVVLDEACGVPESLWDAASTITSNTGSRTLAIGNPDDPLSRFAVVCQPGTFWNVIGIGADDTPNFTGEVVSSELAASLISRRWAEQKKIEWGIDSPLYVSKVLGKFPVDAEDGVVPVSFVNACRYLGDDPSIERGARHGGLDVGETSDRTVLFVREGMRALKWHVIDHHGDAMTAVGMIVNLINEYELETLTVDVIGIGWGVYSRLKELSRAHNRNDPSTTHGCTLKRFSAGEQAHDPERFYNKRAELWWEVGREQSRLKRWDLSVCTDDIIAELVAPKYRIEGSKSRIAVERKDDVRQRLGRSPDIADALLMAFYTGDPPEAPGAYSQANLTMASTTL